MTTHYHGGPHWGGLEVMNALYRNTGAMVSYHRPEQLIKIRKVAESVILDNGAFSSWRKSKKAGAIVNWDEHWAKYYAFVTVNWGNIDYFVIPDVIEGDEAENDRQIRLVPGWMKAKAIPVWHSDESIGKLLRLADDFDRVAIGCCGDHARIRTAAWEKRMDEAFTALYIENKKQVKIHGLRMLDGRVMAKYPFHSCDSANVAINVPKHKIKYPHLIGKLTRTAVLRAAIEKIKPPSVEDWVAVFKQKSEDKYD